MVQLFSYNYQIKQLQNKHLFSKSIEIMRDIIGRIYRTF